MLVGVSFAAKLVKWIHVAENKCYVKKLPNVFRSVSVFRSSLRFSYRAKLVQQPSVSTENMSETVTEKRSTVKLVISGLAISEIFYIQRSYMHWYSREGKEGEQFYYTSARAQFMFWRKCYSTQSYLEFYVQLAYSIATLGLIWLVLMYRRCSE